MLDVENYRSLLVIYKLRLSSENPPFSHATRCEAQLNMLRGLPVFCIVENELFEHLTYAPAELLWGYVS